MKYAKLEEIARTLSPDEMEANLRSLANDNRFAAVLALLESDKKQFVIGGCQQNLCGSHGALAHNAGSIYALTVLTGKIKQLCDPPKRRGQAAPVATGGTE